MSSGINNVLDSSNVLQSGNKSSNNKFSLHCNKDIAPVHCSASKNMACRKSPMPLSNKNFHLNESSVEKDLMLSVQLKDKLDLNSKHLELNGTNIITTDAEVHHGPIETNNCVQEKNLVEPISTETNFRLLNNLKISESAIVSKKGQIISPLSSQEDSLSNYITSSCKINSETNCILKNKEKSHDILCNGYSVSETTSSNSIAISDLSGSPDKSLDSSVSKRIVSSNYPCPSQFDNDSSFGSDSSKVPDISSSSIEISINPACTNPCEITYINYVNENQMSSIMKLIQKDLSEPYSIYTYRYFIHNWPKLCFLAIHNSEVVGAIVCKLDMHKKTTVRGYIAMLAVDEKCRKKKIGSNLVLRAIRAMATDAADEVVLETEITNQPALKLYENLGFVRDKRLFRYYLNGVDALRLKLWLR